MKVDMPLNKKPKNIIHKGCYAIKQRSKKTCECWYAIKQKKNRKKSMKVDMSLSKSNQAIIN